MKFLTTSIDRGLKKVLKYLKIQNEEGITIKTIYRWDELEEALIQQNIKYHKWGFNINTYKHKIYKMLLYNNIRNRILQGELRRDKYSKIDYNSNQ